MLDRERILLYKELRLLTDTRHVILWAFHSIKKYQDHMPIGNGLTTKYFSWDATSPHFALDYEYLQQNPTIDTIYL